MKGSPAVAPPALPALRHEAGWRAGLLVGPRETAPGALPELASSPWGDSPAPSPPAWTGHWWGLQSCGNVSWTPCGGTQDFQEQPANSPVWGQAPTPPGVTEPVLFTQRCAVRVRGRWRGRDSWAQSGECSGSALPTGLYLQLGRALLQVVPGVSEWWAYLAVRNEWIRRETQQTQRSPEQPQPDRG